MIARIEIKEFNMAKNMIDTLVLSGYKVWCKHLYGLPYNIFFEIDDNAVFETDDKQDDIQKIQQKYIDNGDDSCETCMYTDRKSCEEPCVSCSHNYVNHWRLDETSE